MSIASRHFYRDLSGFQDFADFSRPDHYRPLPADWLVVIADVSGSTEAIRDGRYKQVNAVGVACILAITNAVRPLQIPYVFGGDGATACLPVALLERIVPALHAGRCMARDRFRLELRIGVVTVADIRAAGQDVLVGKYQPHACFSQAMFYGDGLRYVEARLKNDGGELPATDDDIGAGSWFDGFECRWNEVPSPHEEAISLLVDCPGSDAADRGRLYAEVLAHVSTIYGAETDYHPLREQNLTLTGSSRLLSVEAAIRCAFEPANRRFAYLLRLHLLKWVGWWLMLRKRRTDSTDWGRYKRQMIVNTDYRKFDEVLRMVIAGSALQRRQLRSVLDGYRQRGDLVYGIHCAPSSVVTCIVSDYNTEHVHFLDGANGGYAMAAVEMKRQLTESIQAPST